MWIIKHDTFSWAQLTNSEWESLSNLNNILKVRELRAESVSFVEEFVEEDDDEGG